MISPRPHVLPTLAAAAILAVAGCTNPTEGAPAPRSTVPGGQITVSAAASLTETFTALGKEFEAAYPGTKVIFNFGASSALAQQIVAGAPADVFAAASPATMRQVTDASAASDMPRVFVRNRLVIAVPRDNPAKVATLADLARPGVKVALCAPQVPCGAAAKTALDAAGVTVTPVTLEQDVKATLTKVRLGEVDAALVYRTDAKAAAADVNGIDFAEAEKAINDYPIVALKAAPNPTGAAAFVGFITSARARVVFTEAGFQAP